MGNCHALDTNVRDIRQWGTNLIHTDRQGNNSHVHLGWSGNLFSVRSRYIYEGTQLDYTVSTDLLLIWGMKQYYYPRD